MAFLPREQVDNLLWAVARVCAGNLRRDLADLLVPFPVEGALCIVQAVLGDGHQSFCPVEPLELHQNIPHIFKRNVDFAARYTFSSRQRNQPDLIISG